MKNKKPQRPARSAITIDLHVTIDDIVAKLRERGEVDPEAEVLRAKTQRYMVITGGNITYSNKPWRPL